MSNINTRHYWEQRFASGTWDSRGRVQTQEYAKANIVMIDIGSDFNGTILDFGCALGDAIPLYAKAFPVAKLRGIDISNAAIELCRKKFGTIADFLCGTVEDVPYSDVIIASHVMEHIDNDKQVVSNLLTKCTELFIIVPYKENPLYFEHVNYYDESYYNSFTVSDIKTFCVAFKQKLTFKEVIKGLIKLQFQLHSDFTKNMVMFHFKQLPN